MLSPEFLKIFETVPDLYLILSPELKILTASEVYLRALGTNRETITGRFITDEFPEFLVGENASTFVHLRASLQQVLQTKKPHSMGLQPFSVPFSAGGFTEKYWQTLNTPVLDAAGEVAYIIHKVEDVTEKIQHENALAAEHHRLAETQAIGHVGSFEWNCYTDSIYWSDEMFRIHGLEPQSEIITLDRVLSFTYPKDAEIVNARIRGWRQKPQTDSLVHRMLRQDGALRIVERRIQSFADANGKVTHLRGTVHDITELAEAALETRKSKELLQATLESSQDMIQVFEAVRNESGEIIDFTWILNNYQAQAAFGEVIGKSLLTLNPGVIKEGIFETFKQVTETGIPDQQERHYVHEQFDGWFYQSTVKLRDGVATTTHDITRRKKAEQELLQLKEEMAQQAEAKYATIFNSIDEGFCIQELIYNEPGKLVDLRVMEANPAYERQTGFKRENIVGKLHSELGLATDSNWFEKYDRIARTGESETFEDWHESTGRWYHASISRVGGAESRLLAVVFQDITERKNFELQKEFLLKLSDALRFIGNPAKIEAKATELAMEHFAADRCFYCEIERENAIIRRDAASGKQPSVSGTYPLDNFALFKRVVEEGSPIVVYDARTTDLLDEPLRALCLQLQVISFIDVPVIKNGQAVGILCLVQAKPRHWSSLEMQLAQEIAERTWAAVERATAEIALRESQDQLQTYFSASFDVVYRMSADWKTMLQLQGKSFLTSVTSNTTWLDFFIPLHEQARVKNAINQAIADKNTFELEHQVVDANGNLSWVYSRAVPRLNTVGEILDWTGVATDITQRKEAEDALRNSEEKYYTLFDSMDEGYCVIQMIYNKAGEPVDWRYLEVNQAFEKHNGVHNAQGKTIMELVPEIETKWLEIYNRVAVTGQSIRFEEDSPALERVFDLYAFRVGNPAERKLAVLFTNITRRRQAEKALRLSEQRLKELNENLEQAVAERTRELLESKQFTEQVMEASPDFIMIFNLQENKIDFVNREAYQEDEERYRETLEIGYEQILLRAHPEDRAKLNHFISRFRTARDNEIFDLDYRVLKDQQVIWYHTRGKVFKRNEQGEATHYISVVQDISKVKQLEEENLQMRLNQQKELLLAILEAQEEERRRISESLHNGVGQILYATKMSLDQVSKMVPKSAIKPTEDLLTEAIIETRRVSHELVPLILQDFGLKEGLNDLCGKFQNSDLKITCWVKGLPLRLEPYLEIALYRMCQELLNNVVKHAHGTTAAVELTRIDQEIVLQVHDNGIGLEGKSIRNGLGLRTIADRVKLLNGTLEFTQSASGKGTHVIIRIPIEQ